MGTSKETSSDFGNRIVGIKEKHSIAEDKDPKGFIAGWLVLNWIGWMIGIYYGALQFGKFVYPLNNLSMLEDIPDAIMQMYVKICIPLGIGLVVLQSLQLAYYKISKVSWILLSAFAWLSPAFAYIQIRYALIHTDPYDGRFVTYLENLWIIYPVCLFLFGAGIGLVQSLVMGKSMRKPGLWVVVNGIVMIVFGMLVYWIFSFPVGYQLQDIFTLLENEHVYLIPPIYWWLIIWAILPIIASLVTALPTGFLLIKYGSRPGESPKLANK